jgi:hypothetical protein
MYNKPLSDAAIEFTHGSGLKGYLAYERSIISLALHCGWFAGRTPAERMRFPVRLERMHRKRTCTCITDLPHWFASKIIAEVR